MMSENLGVFRLPLLTSAFSRVFASEIIGFSRSRGIAPANLDVRRIPGLKKTIDDFNSRFVSSPPIISHSSCLCSCIRPLVKTLFQQFQVSLRVSALLMPVDTDRCCMCMVAWMCGCMVWLQVTSAFVVHVSDADSEDFALWKYRGSDNEVHAAHTGTFSCLLISLITHQLCRFKRSHGQHLLRKRI